MAARPTATPSNPSPQADTDIYRASFTAAHKGVQFVRVRVRVRVQIQSTSPPKSRPLTPYPANLFPSPLTVPTTDSRVASAEELRDCSCASRWRDAALRVRRSGPPSVAAPRTYRIGGPIPTHVRLCRGEEVGLEKSAKGFGARRMGKWRWTCGLFLLRKLSGVPLRIL